MKDQNEVIQEFNEIVNMTASELEKWLKSNDSESAGWSKEDGSGESVGHDSGRNIVEILKANPDKNPDKYTEDQIQHMRKVVSYCKRHLAQEEKSNNEKSAEEVKKTKSYASLKNWGHDPLKKRAGQNGSKKDAEENGDDEKDESEVGEDENDEEDENEDEKTGDKRKKPAKSESNSNKKRETRQGSGTKSGAKKEENGEEDEPEEDEPEEDEEDDGKNGKKATNGKKSGKAQKKDADENEDEDEGEDESRGQGKGGAKKGPKPGDKVSWNWGGGQPEGKVLDVKADKTSITTKRGNEVSRDGDEEDPAVVLDTGKSKAIKLNHELN